MSIPSTGTNGITAFFHQDAFRPDSAPLVAPACLLNCALIPLWSVKNKGIRARFFRDIVLLRAQIGSQHRSRLGYVLKYSLPPFSVESKSTSFSPHSSDETTPVAPPCGSQYSLRARDAGLARVNFDCRPHRPGSRLKNRFRYMVSIRAVMQRQMKRTLRCINKALPKLVHKFRIKQPDLCRRELNIIHKTRTSRKINSSGRQRLVHR